MYLILKKTWEAFDFSKQAMQGEQRPTIPAGRHEVERIEVPSMGYCLVLKGTKIGRGEDAFRQWINGTDEFQVIIEE